MKSHDPLFYGLWRGLRSIVLGPGEIERVDICSKFKSRRFESIKKCSNMRWIK